MICPHVLRLCVDVLLDWSRDYYLAEYLLRDKREATQSKEHTTYPSQTDTAARLNHFLRGSNPRHYLH